MSVSLPGKYVKSSPGVCYIRGTRLKKKLWQARSALHSFFTRSALRRRAHTHMCHVPRWERTVMNLKSVFRCVLYAAGVKTRRACVPFASTWRLRTEVACVLVPAWRLLSLCSNRPMISLALSLANIKPPRAALSPT